MSKNMIKISSALGGSALFAGGIAWVSSAPWWAILIATIGAPIALILFFFALVINELGKNI